MKKIFATFICLVIFCNFSVCQAKTVRISDDGPEILYQEIKETMHRLQVGYKAYELTRFKGEKFVKWIKNLTMLKVIAIMVKSVRFSEM